MSQQFSFTETPNSRQYSHQQRTTTLEYLAVGETDSGTVNAYALAATSLIVSTQAGTLYRQDVLVDSAGWGQYLVTVPYGPLKREAGNYSFTFDATGATTTIKAAKEHIKSYAKGTNPQPAAGVDAGDIHKGSIGVTEDGDVEGTEVIIPGLKLNVTFRHPQGILTIARTKELSSYRGRTNSDTFLTFAPGELLFLGASGGDGTDTESNVTYMFAASPNVDDMRFGDITDMVKLGHHYAWVEFKPAIAEGNGATQPIRVHIERVYDSMEFATSLGWS